MKKRKSKKGSRKKYIAAVRTTALVLVSTTLSLAPWLWKNYGDQIPIRVKDFHIQGLETLSQEDVRDLVRIRVGDPLFGSWLRETMKSLHTNPRIADVAISRNVAGDVSIRVVEKEPYAFVLANQLFEVDEDGIVLGEKMPKRNDRPILSGPWKNVSDLDSFRREIRDGVRILAYLSQQGFSQDWISELNYHNRRGWTMIPVKRKEQILLGKSDFQMKVERLKVVLADLEKREVEGNEIDLDYRDRVVVKLRVADVKARNGSSSDVKKG